MIKLLVLILVAIIVMQDVEVLKGIKDWVISKDWNKGKYGIPFALIVGLVAGITLKIGVVSAIIDSVGLEYNLPKYFIYFDIGSSCLFISKGPSAFVNAIKKIVNSIKEVDKIRSQLNKPLNSHIEFDETKLE